jgi:dTDP-glucose 4,6-dehydratase
MRILLTGGAGFVGHHIIEHIWKYTDWHIVSLDRLDTSGTLIRVADIDTFDKYKTRLKVVHHDLKAELNDFVVHNIGKVDIILHVAAASHVDRSIDDPMSFLQDNVVGTVNLLNYARKHQPQAQFFYFSTDEVFGPAPKGVNYQENDRYNSGNPYAASKAAAEEFCVAFANTYRMNMKITHTMNIFGERQHPEKFIPKIISKVLKGETVTIHSDKTRTIPGQRFYIHARNVASGVLFLLTKVQTKNGEAEKFNIVGEKEVNNLELANLVADYVGQPLKYEMVDFHSSRPGHDLRYALSGEKMKALGWEPPMSFEKSLQTTVSWTLARKDKWLL